MKKAWRAPSRWWNSVFAIVTLATVSGAASAADLVGEALARYAEVESYTVTLRSYTEPGGPFREVIRYSYSKPGWVRMDFLRPHAGMVLVYDPERKAVRLWPFGQSGPGFSLDPGNWLLASAGGHRADRSDFGALLAQVAAVRERGSTENLEEEVLGGRMAAHIRITGHGEAEVEGVHRFDLWLDSISLMPLKVEAYSRSDGPVDFVLMDDLELNVALSRRLFEKP